MCHSITSPLLNLCHCREIVSLICLEPKDYSRMGASLRTEVRKDQSVLKGINIIKRVKLRRVGGTIQEGAA